MIGDNLQIWRQIGWKFEFEGATYKAACNVNTMKILVVFLNGCGLNLRGIEIEF